MHDALCAFALSRRWRTVLTILSATFFVTGCATARAPNALDPRSPEATNIAELWWVMFVLGTGIFLLVTFLLLYTLFIRNHKKAQGDIQSQKGGRWIIYGGLVLPTIILAVVFVFTLRSMQVLALEDEPPLIIEVVGKMWWWEVRYPDHNIITANEIHIPVNHRVELRLTSADVIHSFWVPQLHGKLDMVPGQTNVLQIQANRERTYRGMCSEFCGLQHARMQFLVVAQSENDFNQWVLQQQQPASTQLSESAQRGREVFFEVGCSTCHAISGTEAVSAFGPNLTHLANRQTLGAAILPNNRGNLGGWITNAQALKPGSLMPPMDIPAADVEPLLDYLQSLE
ncbi:MAG: cytochrome c oxidase subunit II [Anaerolinea sp.]|nr:cytochrome c oxidase subunit II [Anaerolinea sp.]